MARPGILFLFVAFAATSCSKDSAGDASATSVPGAAESPAPVASGTEPTANDISNYTLDMDKMTKWANTFKYLSESAEKDPTLADALKMGQNEKVAETIAKLEANPAARAALGRAGFNARDYVWTTAAWLQAAMTSSILGSTPGAKLPEGQNPKNVEFLKAHEKELEKLAKDAGINEQG